MLLISKIINEDKHCQRGLIIDPLSMSVLISRRYVIALLSLKQQGQTLSNG